MRACLAFFLSGFFPLFSAQAENAPLCAPGTFISRIEVQRINVFDPEVKGEDKAVFRAANWVHWPMLSRVGRIRSLLTIRPGDPCDMEALEEAERSLRELPFLQDAWVEPVSRQGDQVVVRVRVRDAWSTRLQISYRQQGGKNKSTLRIQEINFLGTGTQVALHRTRDQDRTRKTIEFTDPALFGSHWNLHALTANNSDGDEQAFSFGLPFWRLSAPWSFNASYGTVTKDQKAYSGGQTVDRYHLDRRESSLLYGTATGGFHDDRLFRWYAGLRAWKETWTNARRKPYRRPDLVPPDTDLALAQGVLEWRHVDYRRVAFYETARRVEDFDLSRSFIVDAQVAVPGLSQDRGGFLTTQVHQGFELGEGNFLLLLGEQDLRWKQSRVFDTKTTLDGKYYFKINPLQTLFAEFTATKCTGLTGPSRLLLGGDTGLRGYKSRAFDGDNLVLLNIEHRLFASRDMLHLFRLGFVSFLEAGGAWNHGRPLAWGTVHPDIGIGLRVFLLRSSATSSFHVDLAYPLDPNGDPLHPRQWQLSFLTTKGF